MKIWPFGRKKRTPKAEYEDALDWREDRFYDRYSGSVGSLSASGRVVNATSAMKFSAVYACVSLLAGTIASLPCEIFRRGRGVDAVAPDHPVFPLLHDEPEPMLSAFVFWETCGFYLFLEGNGYALIGRNPDGTPRSLSVLPSWAVDPAYSPDKSRIWYRVWQTGKVAKIFDQSDVLHFPCIGWDRDTLRAMSPLTAARESIGLGLSGEEFNAKYFTNGITSDIVIKYAGKLTSGPEGSEERLKTYLKDRYSGRGNLRLPLVLQEGGDAHSLAMSAEDAQLIESRDFQVEDICRFYGVPLHLVSSTKKSTSWGTGIEQQTLGFVKFTLRRRLKMIEQEINRKLIRDPNYYCKFNLDALLRADTKTRYEAHKIALGGTQAPAFMTPNEARGIEGLPPLPGGDTLYRPKENEGNADSQQ